MEYDIRTVRVEDWAELKVLRLAALSDPVARVAFCDDFDDAAARTDGFWRGRATPIADGGAATSLVAVTRGGMWVAMLAVLDETGEIAPAVGALGAVDEDGATPPQVHIVSVYVRPEHRGTGVADQLLRSALAWSWENTTAQRVRLWVHEENARAFDFYLRIGFTKTGETMVFPPVPAEMEHELEVRRPLATDTGNGRCSQL